LGCPYKGDRVRQIDTIVLVRNIRDSVAFFSEVIGLEILSDWGSMVVFKNRLALHQMDLLQPQDVISPNLNIDAIGSGNLVIYIGTDRIEEELSRLQSLGVEVIHGIIQLPWQRVFRIRDNCGYIVEVGEESGS